MINYIDFPEVLSEKFKEKYSITWNTPTQRIEDWLDVPSTCKKCKKGFIFAPEYSEQRCSNVKCNWNLGRKHNSWVSMGHEGGVV